VPLSKAEVLDRIWDANSQAYLSYVAKSYPGIITDICPSSQYRLFDSPGFKWEHVDIGGLRQVILPVNPPAILADPFVKHLAAALRKCFDEAIQRNLTSVDHGSNVYG
jgi:hypothetical protein